jgi:type I restriction enzyme S subunit
MSKQVKYVPITDLLTDIIDNRGKSVPTVDEGFPLIATNCIKHSSIYPTFDKVRYVSENILKTWFRAHLKPNDILFVNKGTPGRVCLVPNPVTFCAAQDMMAFRSNPEKINYKYLFAVLRSKEIQKNIENNHVGLVIPHFRKQELASLLIPIKSKKEQGAIGDLYISLSEKIELNNRINTELEAMAKTLYDYWFVQFDFPDKNGKPYKTSGGKMVWNEELKREVPEGWEKGSLNSLGEIIGGSTPPREVAEYFTTEGTAWITPKDLSLNTGNKFITKGELDVSEKGIKAASLNIMPKGSILLSSRAPIGYLAISREIVTTNQGFKSFVPNKGFSTEYVYYTIQSMIPTIENNGVGSTFREVSASTLRTIPILLADKNVVKSYTVIVKDIFERQNILEIENQKLTELRDWLLPMLMNGQVKIVDEKESELLMAAEPKMEYGK